MSYETHVDGNALGGLFHDLFGREMTDQLGCCASCGAVNPLAALLAFRQAPGDVVRCAACGEVIMVAVSRGDRVRVSFESLRWIEVRPS